MEQGSAADSPQSVAPQARLLELTQQQLTALQSAASSAQAQAAELGSSTQQHLSRLSEAVAAAAPNMHLPAMPALDQGAVSAAAQQQLAYLQHLSASQLANLVAAAAHAKQGAAAQLAAAGELGQRAASQLAVGLPQRQQQQDSPRQAQAQSQPQASPRQAQTQSQPQASQKRRQPKAQAQKQHAAVRSAAQAAQPASGPLLPPTSQSYGMLMGALLLLLPLLRAGARALGLRRRRGGTAAGHEIAEAEARARAARRRERTRQRFQRALAAAEDFEASSIDSSVFSAVSMKGASSSSSAAVGSVAASGPTAMAAGVAGGSGGSGDGGSQLPAAVTALVSMEATSGVAAASATGDGSAATPEPGPASKLGEAQLPPGASANPFLRSMAGVHWSPEGGPSPEGWPAAGAGAAGAGPEAGAAADGSGDELEEDGEEESAGDLDRMDAETRRAWEAFVRSSKVRGGQQRALGGRLPAAAAAAVAAASGAHAAPPCRPAALPTRAVRPALPCRPAPYPPTLCPLPCLRAAGGPGQGLGRQPGGRVGAATGACGPGQGVSRRRRCRGRSWVAQAHGQRRARGLRNAAATGCMYMMTQRQTVLHI